MSPASARPLEPTPRLAVRALVSQSAGLAVFDDGARLGVVDAHHSTEVRDVDEREAGRLLRDARDVETLEVVDVEALRRHVDLRREREELLHATLVLLDGARPRPLRELAARIWSETVKRAAWTWVEGVLLSTPAPSDADFVGAAELAGASVFRELGGLQPRVRSVLRAWRSIPDEAFPEGREVARAMATREGWFRTLVRGNAAGEGATPFDGVLRKWAEGLREDPPPWAVRIRAARRPPAGHDGRVFFAARVASRWHQDVTQCSVLGGLAGVELPGSLFALREWRELLPPATETPVDLLVGAMDSARQIAFEARGAAIDIRPGRHHHVTLENPLARQALKLRGETADLVAFLDHRLVTDLESGLPYTSAGWFAVADIARGLTVSDAWVVGHVQDARDRLARAGLEPGILEVHGDRVRLSPTLRVAKQLDFPGVPFAVLEGARAGRDTEG